MEKSEFTEEQILHGLPLVEQEAGVSSVLPGGSANAHQTKRRNRIALLRGRPKALSGLGATLEWSNGLSPGRQTRLDPVGGHASMKPTISFHKLRNFGFWHRRKCDQQIHNYTGISKTR